MMFEMQNIHIALPEGNLVIFLSVFGALLMRQSDDI